ncbi:hypothetical protein D3C75_794320 [compost metagenome]
MLNQQFAFVVAHVGRRHRVYAPLLAVYQVGYADHSIASAHSFSGRPCDVLRISVTRIGAPLTAHRGGAYDDVGAGLGRRRQRWEIELARHYAKAGDHPGDNSLGTVADLTSRLTRGRHRPGVVARDVLRLGAQIGLRTDEVDAGNVMEDKRPRG